MTTQAPSKELFKDEPHLLDWTGIDGSPFEVAEVYAANRTLISIQECVLNVEGARALRDWLNKVLPASSPEPPVGPTGDYRDQLFALLLRRGVLTQHEAHELAFGSGPPPLPEYAAEPDAVCDRCGEKWGRANNTPHSVYHLCLVRDRSALTKCEGQS